MYLGANCTALTDFLLSNSCVFFSQRPPGPSPSPIPPADKISFIQTTEGWRANKYRKNIENTIPYFITLYHCDTGHGYRISPCSSQIITLLSSLQDANIYTNHKNNKINSTRESQVTVSIQHALQLTDTAYVAARVHVAGQAAHLAKLGVRPRQAPDGTRVRLGDLAAGPATLALWRAGAVVLLLRLLRSWLLQQVPHLDAAVRRARGEALAVHTHGSRCWSRVSASMEKAHHTTRDTASLSHCLTPHP